ncbi:transposable element Tcb1 transposase [Trichonephila clavipes]|nr:transposable element Tcb1 transposase [Trichonephila clavipes]
MSRRKQRSAFDQVSEFDRGSIVAYRDTVDYLSRKSVVVLDETKQLTIRRRLLQSGHSARCPLLFLPLTQNHRSLRRQWCDERRMGGENGMKLSLLTNRASVCNTTMVGFEPGDTVERMLNSCIMHPDTGPAPGIMVWSGTGYQSRIPLVRIAGTLIRQRYISEELEPVVLQGMATAIFQQDSARGTHCPKVLRQSTD